MALCRDCCKLIPCHCHLAPPVEIWYGAYLAGRRHEKTTRTTAVRAQQDGARP